MTMHWTELGGMNTSIPTAYPPEQTCKQWNYTTFMKSWGFCFYIDGIYTVWDLKQMFYKKAHSVSRRWGSEQSSVSYFTWYDWDATREEGKPGRQRDSDVLSWLHKKQTNSPLFPNVFCVLNHFTHDALSIVTLPVFGLQLRQLWSHLWCECNF